ncbi:MAG: tetratricopeptide repeat protein [Myxococcaceae bacterium]
MLFSAFVLSAVVTAPLLGPSVGNADVLSSQGATLYNQKQYAQAAEKLLRSIYANPTSMGPYLMLARSQLADKQVAQACATYRAYLKAAPPSLDRDKAQKEMELCERQRAAAGAKALTLESATDARRDFFGALSEGRLLGDASASAILRQLVARGYIGADLAEMAAKLHSAALAAAEALHAKAIAREALTPEQVGQGHLLFELAHDVGTPAPRSAARASFLRGVTALNAGDGAKAEDLFAKAADADPSTRDYTSFRALAVYARGDKTGALRIFETHLPDDPRTGALRAELALSASPEAGAAELERVLFQQQLPR